MAFPSVAGRVCDRPAMRRRDGGLEFIEWLEQHLEQLFSTFAAARIPIKWHRKFVSCYIADLLTAFIGEDVRIRSQHDAIARTGFPASADINTRVEDRILKFSVAGTYLGDLLPDSLSLRGFRYQPSRLPRGHDISDIPRKAYIVTART